MYGARVYEGGRGVKSVVGGRVEGLQRVGRALRERSCKRGWLVGDELVSFRQKES